MRNTEITQYDMTPYLTERARWLKDRLTQLEDNLTWKAPEAVDCTEQALDTFQSWHVRHAQPFDFPETPREQFVMGLTYVALGTLEQLFAAHGTLWELNEQKLRLEQELYLLFDLDAPGMREDFASLHLRISQIGLELDAISSPGQSDIVIEPVQTLLSDTSAALGAARDVARNAIRLFIGKQFAAVCTLAANMDTLLDSANQASFEASGMDEHLIRHGEMLVSQKSEVARRQIESLEETRRSAAILDCLKRYGMYNAVYVACLEKRTRVTGLLALIKKCAQLLVLSDASVKLRRPTQ